MGHQLSQEANLEFKEESVSMQHMLFTSTVLVTGCNWPLFKQQSVDTIKMFGTMESLWKLFYYSPKKAEALKDVQNVLGLPELKVVKPSSTRWLSHEMHTCRKKGTCFSNNHSGQPLQKLW